MNLTAPCSEICSVDVEPMVAWLRDNPQSWPEVAPTKPGRVFVLPALFQAVAEKVMAEMAIALKQGTDLDAHQPMLSRMAPGQSHPMHVDSQRADWITRVHVPLVTNSGCWFMWEGDRRIYECEVCGNWPDEDGVIDHGRGCYTQNEDGGGSSMVDSEGAVGIKVHFEIGLAYTFDTTKRHAFGNNGETERIHLIFDVLRQDV